MLHSQLFNAKDIDPTAFVENVLGSACLQLASLQKNGRPRWTAQEVHSKLLELTAETREEDTDEDIQGHLELHPAELVFAILQFAFKERMTCYMLQMSTCTYSIFANHHVLPHTDYM